MQDNNSYAIQSLAKYLKDDNHFYAKTTKEQNLLRDILDAVSPFQYCPGKDSIVEYILDSSSDNFCQIINDYTFIPIETICNPIKLLDKNIHVSINTNWAQLNGRPKDNILIDITNIDGEYVNAALLALEDFFNDGVVITSLSSEDESSVSKIEEGVKYFITVLLDPIKYNPFGIIYESLENVIDACNNCSFPKNEISSTFDSMLNVYRQWSQEAVNEYYDWFFLFQSEKIKTSIENSDKDLICFHYNENLKSIKFDKIIKKTFPLLNVEINSNDKYFLVKINRDFDKSLIEENFPDFFNKGD